MIVYLAGFKTIENTYNKNPKDIYLLSSFFEHKTASDIPKFLYQEKHILDSGAYSTFNNIQKAKSIDWIEYTKKYIQFIKKTNAKLFFELDIDGVVGLQKVEYLRKLIEDGVGLQPIPVWHANRKYDYFLKMCENYKYVAIGTTPVTEEGKVFRKNPKLMNKFINDAHKNNCKIHGLGFTQMDLLPYLKFDSVDSTTWIGGGRYATSYVFINGKIKSASKPKGMVMKDKGYKDLNLFNFEQWVKFQKYAENNL